MADVLTYRRAQGRHRYNLERRATATERSQIALTMMLVGLGFGRGTEAAVARRLGVHKSTLSRGLRAALRALSPEGPALSYGFLQAVGQPLRVPLPRGRPRRDAPSSAERLLAAWRAEDLPSVGKDQ